MIPAFVACIDIVGEFIAVALDAPVGSIALARPKSKTFTVPSGADFDVRGLQIAMDDPLLVRRFERLGDLFRDRQRFVERDGTAHDSLGEILARDQFHDKSVHPAGFFKAVDVGDVRVVQRRQGLSFACEPCEPFGIARDQIGQHFDRDVTIQLRIARPIHYAHSAGTEAREDFVRAEAGTRGEGQILWIIWAGAAAPTGLLASDAAPATDRAMKMIGAQHGTAPCQAARDSQRVWPNLQASARAAGPASNLHNTQQMPVPRQGNLDTS